MKLQDLLRHIADNVENGKDWSDSIDINDETAWSASVFFGEAGSIKLKHRTHDVNGFPVQSPEVEAPAYGAYYYISCPAQVNWYEVYTWCNSAFDNRALNRGCVFLTKEAAIANAKAMLGIDPYSEGEK